ncbi:MAG: hypothetical protein AB1513_01665 [Pseudomonadota bacterium]
MQVPSNLALDNLREVIRE